jgi:hypothetical protein
MTTAKPADQPFVASSCPSWHARARSRSYDDVPCLHRHLCSLTVCRSPSRDERRHAGQRPLLENRFVRLTHLALLGPSISPACMCCTEKPCASESSHSDTQTEHTHQTSNAPRRGPNRPEFPKCLRELAKCFQTLVVKIEKTNSNSKKDQSKRINFTRVDPFVWSTLVVKAGIHSDH